MASLHAFSANPVAHRPIRSRSQIELQPLTASQIARQIDGALETLRKSGRRAIRILDIGCGDGSWLLNTVSYAPTLGFVAIEGRGIDRARPMIERARGAAVAIADPRIGVSFRVADVATALAEEEDHGDDIVLCHRGVIATLPTADCDRVMADIARITAGTFICVGGAQ